MPASAGVPHQTLSSSTVLAASVALFGALAAPFSAPVGQPQAGASHASVAALTPVQAALRQALSQPGADPDLAAFYEGRQYRPLWIDGLALAPAAQTVVVQIDSAAQDGLNPDDYQLAQLRSVTRPGAPMALPALVQAELVLSRSFSSYAADLHSAPAQARMFYADPSLDPGLDQRRGVLQGAARAADLKAFVLGVGRMNPIYLKLRSAWLNLRKQEAKRPAGNQAGQDPLEQRIRANMERARAFPPDFGPRYVLVNAAAQALQFYDGGRLRGSMPVVVGKPDEQTPVMAGLIRYAVVRPYWNVPPDLVRDSIAPKVLSEGLSYFTSKNFEILSDWSDNAVVVDPATIDWSQVAAGEQQLRVRQRPGPDNMMGAVKFMFPNTLGVYLHDTPIKALFDERQRTFSSGCVRLKDARLLGLWLFGRPVDQAASADGPEQPVALTAPVPVYIVYLTADPKPGGLSFAPDIYGRDAPLMASLIDRNGRPSPSQPS